MHSVRRALVAVACLPLMTLAACGDGDSEADEPTTPSPSVSESSSPSASPTPTATPIEELPAEEVDPEAFVRAWVDVYNEAALNGDVERLESFSTKECTGCTALVVAIKRIYSVGGSIEVTEPPKTILSMTELKESSEKVKFFDVQIATGAGTSRKSANATPKEYEAGEDLWLFKVAITEDRWRITGLGE